MKNIKKKLITKQTNPTLLSGQQMYTRKPRTSGKCCPVYIKSESTVTEIPIAQDIMDETPNLYDTANAFLKGDSVEINCEEELKTLNTEYMQLFTLTNTILERLGDSKVTENVWWTQQKISSEATGVGEEEGLQDLLKNCFEKKKQLEGQIAHASSNVQTLQSRLQALRALQATKSSFQSRSPFTQGMSGHQHYPPGYDGRNAFN